MTVIKMTAPTREQVLKARDDFSVFCDFIAEPLPPYHVNDFMMKKTKETIRAVLDMALKQHTHPDWEKFIVEIENMGDGVTREDTLVVRNIVSSPATNNPVLGADATTDKGEVKADDESANKGCKCPDRNQWAHTLNIKCNHEFLLENLLEIICEGIEEPAGRGAGFGIRPEYQDQALKFISNRVKDYK